MHLPLARVRPLSRLKENIPRSGVRDLVSFVSTSLQTRDISRLDSADALMRILHTQNIFSSASGELLLQIGCGAIGTEEMVQLPKALYGLVTLKWIEGGSRVISRKGDPWCVIWPNMMLFLQTKNVSNHGRNSTNMSRPLSHVHQTFSVQKFSHQTRLVVLLCTDQMCLPERSHSCTILLVLLDLFAMLFFVVVTPYRTSSASAKISRNLPVLKMQLTEPAEIWFHSTKRILVAKGMYHPSKTINAMMVRSSPKEVAVTN